MFHEIKLNPSHQNRSLIVTWNIDPAIAAAEFWIYKKVDGGAEWELLNSEPVYGTSYTDTEFVIPNKEQVPMYKIVALLGDAEYESGECTLFSRYDRKAYGVAKNIIRLKYLQARQDGIPVLHYSAIKNGALSDGMDAITGQRLRVPCKGEAGTYYANGYYSPKLTFIRLPEATGHRHLQTDDSLFDENSQRAEFLAFPPVRSRDMIVDVATDRRWIVGDAIECDLVKSVIPIAYRALIARQAHNHPCYNVPIPANYDELLASLCLPH